MVYLIIIILLVSIWDIKDMKGKNKKKDFAVYVIMMFLVGALGIYYFLNPKRDSFSEILLSLIGQEG